MIKFIPIKWINNEINLDWIQHFDKYIKNHFTNAYWMLIINSHKNHIFTKFNKYCKFNKIIIVNIFAHSFHLLQPLNVGLYSFLKLAYSCQINFFIQVSINHITKTEFFIAYLVAHNAIFIEKNIKAKFKNAGILFWDLKFIILKLNIHFYTSTFFSSHSNSSCQWKSQTPKTKK